MKGAPLWKRILNEGLVSWGREKNDPLLLQCVEKIIKAPIITDHRPIDVDFDAKHTVAFPFKEFWLEGYSHECPKVVLSYGALVVRVGEVADGCIGRALCVLASTRQFPIVVGTYEFQCDPSGNVMEKQILINPVAIESHGLNFMKKVGGNIGEMALDTMDFLCCKNIGLEPRESDESQTRRAAKRFGGSPGDYKYHVLVVRPIGATPGTPGREVGCVARHKCRGHYNHYGPQYNRGLLFGKYAGKFWIDPHSRGNEKNGTVEKDYMVNA